MLMLGSGLAEAPRLDRIEPDSGLAGDIITLYGAGFQTGDDVTFDEVRAYVLATSGTSLEVLVPPSSYTIPGPALVQVRRGELASGAKAFTYIAETSSLQAPGVASMYPRCGTLGYLSDVFISTAYLPEDPSRVDVRFADRSATLREVRHDLIRVLPPEPPCLPPCTVPITVKNLVNGLETTVAEAFAYKPVSPLQITAPVEAAPGSFISIAAQGAIAGVTRVSINGVESESVWVDECNNEIIARVPDELSGLARVTVQTDADVAEDETQVTGLAERCFVPNRFGEEIPSPWFFARDVPPNPEAFHFGEFSGGVVHLLTLPIDQQSRCPTLQFRRQGQFSYTYASYCQPQPPCNDPQTVRLWQLPELSGMTEPSLLDVRVTCWNGRPLENPVPPFRYFVTPNQTSRDFPSPPRADLGAEVAIEGQDVIQRLAGIDHLAGLDRIELWAREGPRNGGRRIWEKIFDRDQIGLVQQGRSVNVEWLGDPDSRRNLIRFNIPNDAEASRLIKGRDVFITASRKVTTCRLSGGQARSYETLLFHVNSGGRVQVSASPDRVRLPQNQTNVETQTRIRVTSVDQFEGDVRLQANVTSPPPASLSVSFIAVQGAREDAICDGRPSPCIVAHPRPGQPAEVVMLIRSSEPLFGPNQYTLRVQAFYPPRSDEEQDHVFVTLFVNSGIRLNPRDLPEGRVGVSYPSNILLEAELGVPPYDWEVCGIRLPNDSLPVDCFPPGLRATAEGPGNRFLRISGTPTVENTFEFPVAVIDRSGEWTSRSYRIVVRRPFFTLSAPAPPQRTVVQGHPNAERFQFTLNAQNMDGIAESRINLSYRVTDEGGQVINPPGGSITLNPQQIGPPVANGNHPMTLTVWPAFMAAYRGTFRVAIRGDLNIPSMTEWSQSPAVLIINPPPPPQCGCSAIATVEYGCRGPIGHCIPWSQQTSIMGRGCNSSRVQDDLIRQRDQLRPSSCGIGCNLTPFSTIIDQGPTQCGPDGCQPCP